MIPSHLILCVSWVAYCFLHSLLAAPVVKNYVQSRHMLGGNYRLWYTLFAAAGFFAILLYQVNLPSPTLFVSADWIRAVGWLVTLTGVLVMVICIYKYFLKLSGLRSLLYEESESKLMITGIQQFVRHPLYSGTFLFIWGLLLLLPILSLLISNCIITIYTLIGMRLEEKKLEAEFGESYKQYKREVPGLLPFTRAKRKDSA